MLVLGLAAWPGLEAGSLCFFQPDSPSFNAKDMLVKFSKSTLHLPNEMLFGRPSRNLCLLPFRFNFGAWILMWELQLNRPQDPLAQHIKNISCWDNLKTPKSMLMLVISVFLFSSYVWWILNFLSKYFVWENIQYLFFFICWRFESKTQVF